MGAVCSGCPCGKKVAPVSPEPQKMTTISKPVQRSPTPALTQRSISPIFTQQTTTPIPTQQVTTPIPTQKATTPTLPQSFSASPFSNSGISKGNSLDLIRGFENEPLVSLEEALAPFHGKIDDVDDYIQEAKTKCHYPSENHLTRDESAAIYIYTRRWGKGCLYEHLQTAWNSRKPSEMKPWFRYIKLFKAAYDKLPTATEEIWQGKPFDPTLHRELNTDSAPLYPAMGIFSPSKTSVERYLSSVGVSEKILIGFQRVGAKLPGAHAADIKYAPLVFPGPKLGRSHVEMSDDGESAIYHLVGPKGKYSC